MAIIWRLCPSFTIINDHLNHQPPAMKHLAGICAQHLGTANVAQGIYVAPCRGGGPRGRGAGRHGSGELPMLVSSANEYG